MFILVYILTLLNLINCNGVGRQHPWQNQHLDGQPAAPSDSSQDILKALEMRFQKQDYIMEMQLQEVETMGKKLREKEDRLMVLEQQHHEQQVKTSLLEVDLNDTKLQLNNALENILKLQLELQTLQIESMRDQETMNNRLDRLEKLLQESVRPLQQMQESTYFYMKFWDGMALGVEKIVDTVVKCIDKALHPLAIAQQKVVDSIAQCIGMMTIVLALAYFTYHSLILREVNFNDGKRLYKAVKLTTDDNSTSGNDTNKHSNSYDDKLPTLSGAKL